MPQYVIHVRRKSSGGVWLVLFLWVIGGLIVVAAVPGANYWKSRAQEFHNPLNTAPDDEPLPNTALGLGDDPIPDVAPAPPNPIKTELPQPVVKPVAGHVVAEASINGEDRCIVSGFLTAEKTAALKFEIDTGAGDALVVSATHLAALGIKPKSLQFREYGGDTRFGKFAYATLREVRIGDAVVKNVDAEILTRWRYSFGASENPLIGIPFLKKSGLHVEVSGDTCKLVGPPTTIAGVMNRLIDIIR
jgi:hypothetical protein